ncbi:MAG: hypothetical protein HQ581_27340, partial [Planctomycetes bacterium]|nr:hypothetical protein [Planctomycetota bacterium]
IGAFTFNGDMRSNQDFEVRLANNAKRPGKMPKFDKRAQLTTGEVNLGNDRGGFHTRFVDSAGGPLVPEKVDWVQLSIWQTYPTKAGQPARTKIPSSSSAYIELEVLGEESDVVVPSAEQLAFRKAVREAPKKPELVKMETWQQTLIASREAIYEWETLQDRLATFSSGADFQPWYVLGPFSPKSKEAKNITRLKQIDLAARYPGKDGKDIGWVERKDLVDGPVHDLARLPGVEKGDVIFLCRPVTFHREFARSELYLDAATDAGSLRWLPSGKRVNSLRPVTTSRIGTELTAVAGEYQFLLELKADDAGRCRFRFSPQPVAAKPGAGSGSARMNRRHNLVTQLREESTDPIARAQLRWEGEDFLWSRSPQEKKTMGDWVPGHSAPFIEPRYRAAIERRLTKLENELTADQGVIAQAIAPMKSRIDTWIERFRGTIGEELDPVALRAKYYQLAAVQEMLASSGRVRSLRLAVEDQRKTFGERYPRAGEFFARIDALDRNVRAAWERILDVDSAALEILVQTKGELDLAAPEILLANPVLAFDKLLMVKGNTGFSSNWGGPNSLGSEMVILSPVRPDGQFTTIHQGTVSDMDLHWDARRILFSDRSAVWEIGVDGTGLRRVTAEDSPVTHYDACYLPSGKIVCVSNACEQAVPCTGGPNVGNLHVMDADGTSERRVTFDQDHDWNPVVMHDGRVLYTRWEYTDAPHYFSRLLFRMNPDGSNQKEYYGSNSYWPNATYWPRPIPGHPTMISCVVSGHHGVSRVGEMLLLDPAKGRHEANGAVQKIPGYGKKVEPTMLDRLVVDVWP